MRFDPRRLQHGLLLITKLCTSFPTINNFYMWLIFYLRINDLHEKRHLPDCSLRQGAGGKEFARFGPITCFLRWLYKRSQPYFDQKPEEHCFSIKKRCLDIKNDDLWEKWVTEKKRWLKTDFLMNFLDDSAWLCMEKLKKT